MAKIFQLFTLAAAFAALFTGVNGGWDPRSSNMIAGYWGQNSMGTADGQQRLIHYCPSDKIDVILLSFLPSLRNMHSLNFANQEVGPLEHDIQDCQNNHKKSILLSIGGETTSDIGWGTRDEAVKAARDLWAAYGPPIDPDIHRPLGNAIVEGIDICILTTGYKCCASSRYSGQRKSTTIINFNHFCCCVDLDHADI
ncbi:hypothetical protein WAI453_004531 [Rhynchosporium graminicola]